MKTILISGSYKGLNLPKEIIEFIKKNIKDQKIISFIASDFEDNEGTKKFVDELVNLFEEHSVNFEKVHVIDSSKTQYEMHLNLEESNLIFLLGGDTLKQIKYIEKYSLKGLIKQENKIILGISAGAINLFSQR